MCISFSLVPGGYVSLTNANTYLIDATGTDPVLLPATAPSAAVVAAANAAAAESSSYHPFKPSGGMYPTPSPYPGAGVDEADRAALFHRSSHISGGVTSSHQSAVAAAAAAASGHCNHLNDGCECFRDYSMHRKVN